MNDYLKLKLFRLLSEVSIESTNDEMQSAYEEFVEQAKEFNQSGIDFQRIFRALKLTYIELVSLETMALCRQGKKCP